jgi:hypothetical protein
MALTREQKAEIGRRNLGAYLGHWTGISGGKPKGVKNKKTMERMALELGRLKTMEVQPQDVMYDNMMFAHTKAREIVHSILQRYKMASSHRTIDPEKDPDAYAEHLVELMEEFAYGMKMRDYAQRYAVDLAPYLHPRLSAIAVKPVPPDGPVTDLDVNLIEGTVSYAVRRILDGDDLPPLAQEQHQEAAE